MRLKYKIFLGLEFIGLFLFLAYGSYCYFWRHL